MFLHAGAIWHIENTVSIAPSHTIDKNKFSANIVFAIFI